MADIPIVSRLRPYAESKTISSIKSKIPFKLDSNNNNGKENIEIKQQREPKERHDTLEIFAVKKQAPAALGWNQLRNPFNAKRNETALYDTTKEAQYNNMDEETLFESFNQMSLLELCNTAGKCAELKHATQKYFEVIYTSVNMAWLIEENVTTFTLQQARRLLQTFGAFMSTLKVNTAQLERQEDKEELLETIGKYCSGLLLWNSK